MPPEIAALIAKPVLLALTLGVGAILGMIVERIVESQNRAKRRAYWQARNGWKKSRLVSIKSHRPAVPTTPQKIEPLTNAIDQLRRVIDCDFEARPLLNKSEARVYRELDQLVVGRNSEWQVMAQVSVGEFVTSKDRAAYSCINSKRVDLLLVDGECKARHAIEYQGDGHYLSDAPARDAVKKEALRKAGIGYHEVVAGHTTPTDLRRLVDKLVPPSG